MIAVDPTTLSRRQLIGLANGLVAPRPIAWVSSIGPNGTPNLAPFSFFNCFSTAPLTLGIGPGSRAGVNKDTLHNVKASGELTVSVVTQDLATRANLTSAEFERDVDEWEVVGITPRPSVTVAPPSVNESPAAFECRVFKIVDLGEPDVPTNSLIIARVSYVHVSEVLVRDEHYRIDAEAAALVGRMGADLWSTTRDRFSLRRPTIEESHAGVDAIPIEPDPASRVD
jgi:flavin reductase (DIM6/NTAB) family NADH-FMN oxidoreductase RutF